MKLVAHPTLTAQSVPDSKAPHLVMWNTAAFAELRPELREQRRQFDAVIDGRLVGSVVGALDGDMFTMGASAPFGAPDFTREYEPVRGVEDLLMDTFGQMADAGVRQVLMRMKPPHFSATEPGLLFSLLSRGCCVAESNLNFYIDLTGYRTVDDYLVDLKKPARRAVRHGELLGLRSALLAEDDEAGWYAAYEVLRVNRANKGRPTRLSHEYVCAIRDAFPGLVRMLVVSSDDTVCAAALLYRIGARRDVVQYWGDAGHELVSSPMNFLVREVVAHCVETGSEYIDLGISTDHGEPNHGLIQFKRSVGARSEVRLEVACPDLPRFLRAGR